MLRTWMMLLAACGAPTASTPEHGADAHGAHEAPHEAPAHPAIEAPALDAGGAVTYRVDLSRSRHHLVDVAAVAPTGGADEQTWMMPVWTPGSYLVREYARNLEGLSAEGPDGTPLPVEKVAKNRWTIQTGGADPVTVRYTLYAHELSVRANHADADQAVLNGAATWLTPVELTEGPYAVELALPDGWSGTETGLDPHADGRPHHYVALGFDELVDSPILAGNPSAHDFEVEGVPHRLVHLGADGLWDEEASLEDVKAIVEAQVAFWGFVPYRRYVFLNVVLPGAGGGLEHLDSTLMMFDRDAGAYDAVRKRWLGLVSHEFFHTWNVKRMRPRGLGPFDYEVEVHTPSLWVAEGLTSYYDDLLLVRAGLLTPDEHLARLSGSIGGVQGRPGRHVQPLSRSSYDAWIKHYRPDENSVNSAVSYYRKGSVVGLLLDGEIRRRTGGARSLDDVMRALYPVGSGVEGYTADDVVDVASRIAGEDLSGFFVRFVTGTDELDYTPTLDWLGLRFRPAPEPDEDDPAPGWLGLELSGTPPRVQRLLRDTPAWEAGIGLEDELLAVDGWRVRDAGAWDTLREQWRPGDEVELLLGRNGRVVTQRATLGEAPRDTWTLEVDRSGGTTGRIRREAWWQAPE